MSSRGKYIGEYARRSAEYVVFQFNAFIDRYIVLYPDPVSYPDIVPDIDILSERAVLADGRTFLDMAEMPDAGAFAYPDPFIGIARLMYEITFLFHC